MPDLSKRFQAIALQMMNVFIIAACNNGDNASIVTDQRIQIPEPDIKERLHSQKAVIDTNVVKNIYLVDSFIRYDKVSDSINNLGPEGSEGGVEFRVFMDAGRHIICAEEEPFSQSGDWAMTIVHYFDNAGKTFAIEQRTGVVYSPCTDGGAVEVKTFLYDDGFRMIEKERRLTDGIRALADSCFPDFKPYDMQPIPTSSLFVKKHNLRSH